MENEQDQTIWLAEFAKHWPTLAWIVPVFIVLYYGLKFLSLANETVSTLMGGLGRRWKDADDKKRERQVGEVSLLRDEVTSLGRRVDALQKRDEIYWAYVMYDEDWHRKDAMARIASGDDASGHLSFLEFRAKWIRERYRHDEFKDEDTW